MQIVPNRMGNLHHSALSIFKDLVIGLPYFRIKQQGVCIGFALGMYAKDYFPSNEVLEGGFRTYGHAYDK